jgi:hypothetical protein
VRADGQAIGNPGLFRGLVVAVPAFGGILWAVCRDGLFGAENRQRQLDWVRQKDAMMRVLRWCSDARSRSAASPRSATALPTHVGRPAGGPTRRR